jgi:hypothetical protein
LRSRSSDVARRELPAPEAVPVDRFVGSGLVGPRRVRPASGVWASSRSLPVPDLSRVERSPTLPTPLLVRFVADFGCLPFVALARRGGFAAFVRAAFPFGVFAAAPGRPVFLVLFRRGPAPLRAAAREPAPAFFPDGVVRRFAFGVLAMNRPLSRLTLRR